MRSRAYRRHKRAVKLARRYRLLTAFWHSEGSRSPRSMHAHINCSCFDEPREQALRRRREGRAWRREWDL